jgi:hypothetical protein
LRYIRCAEHSGTDLGLGSLAYQYGKAKQEKTIFHGCEFRKVKIGKNPKNGRKVDKWAGLTS